METSFVSFMFKTKDCKLKNVLELGPVIVELKNFTLLVRFFEFCIFYKSLKSDKTVENKDFLVVLCVHGRTRIRTDNSE